MVARSPLSTCFRSRGSVMLMPSGPPAPGQPVVGVAQSAVGQYRAPVADRVDDLVGVARVERADVAPVDRLPRRHIAGAGALELSYLGVLQSLARLLDGVVDALGARHHAGDAGAD